MRRWQQQQQHHSRHLPSLHQLSRCVFLWPTFRRLCLSSGHLWQRFCQATPPFTKVHLSFLIVAIMSLVLVSMAPAVTSIPLGSKCPRRQVFCSLPQVTHAIRQVDQTFKHSRMPSFSVRHLSNRHWVANILAWTFGHGTSPYWVCPRPTVVE
ncbi:hypothetical protein EDB86DRAFT_1261490 [Lactarius hatsudake]|nr:hypothetical protein EDB86DRAFT_1261490 [Lactarius hatsudake]